MCREHERAADEEGEGDGKKKKTSKGVGQRKKAKKAGGRVFAADIFVAILQPGIKVYCAVLRTSLSLRDLFVHSPSAGSYHH